MRGLRSVARGGALGLLGLVALGCGLAPGRAEAADLDAAVVQGAAAVRERAAAQGRLSVIVQLKAAEGVERLTGQALERARDELRRTLAGVGVASVRGIGRSPFAALEVDPRQLDVLLRSGLVSTVEENVRVERHLAQSVPLVKAPQAWSAGADGAGQVVVVVDDGVDGSHPFLAGRVVAEACAAPDCDDDPYGHDGPGTGQPCAGCQHGTHVAGAAAGRGGTVKGVAPQASIASIRVFSASGDATWEGLANALDYARNELAGRHEVAAVNMSLGTPGYRSASHCDADWPAMAFQINALHAAGILTAVSSGNEYSKGGIAAPACIAKALSVGASTDHGTEAVADFSNSAPILDVLAPGEWITSSVPGGGFAEWSGTSMAAPHVAGALADLRSKNPGWTPAQLEAALEAEGKPVTDPGNGLSHPRIDVAAAAGDGGGGGWDSWAGLGGSLASFPECERAGSRIDCWAQGAGGTLAWWRSADGDAWSGPASLGGSVASAPECLVRGGRIDCFVTTPAKRLAQITHNGSGWGGWVDLGGTVVARPSCVPAAGLALDCFAAGTDKALHRRSFDGGAWRPWERLGGSTIIRPECVARSGGIDCFVVDGSKNLHARRLSGGRWGAWQKLGTGFGLAPQCLVAGSKADCFAQGASLGLLKGYFNGTRWSKWTTVPGAGGVNTQPHCSRTGSGFDCYWVSKTADLVRKVRDGAVWLGTEDLGGAVQQRPVCLAGPGGRIDCLARGLDNTLHQRTYH